MTDDPKRLLSDRSGVDPLERELLASMQRLGPPEGARDAAWQGIAAQLATGIAVGAGAAAASSAAVAKAGAGSLLPGALASKAVLALAAGGVAASGYFAAQHAFDDTAAKTTRGDRSVAAQVRPSAPRAASAAGPVAEPAATEAPAARLEHPVQHSGERRRADLLRAESALLTRARAQLRSGHVRAARATLARLQAQFPAGVLVQEREVLAIEALSAYGNAAAAQRRARAFVATYPDSPHSAKLSRFLDPP